MKHLYIILLLVFLQACASQSQMIKSSASIKAGMSVDELKKAMGEPQNRQFEGKNEAWQYCSTDYSGFEADHYVLVWVANDRVTGMQTYRNTLYGTCESFFRMVDWTEAPDASIEIRNR